MSPDEPQQETLTLNQSSTAPFSETTLPQQSDLIGKAIDGRYLIEKELGQGGIGTVYLARDRKLHDKRVVVKVLLEESLRNSWVVQKFQQEKEALARVDHLGVVGILDTGELPDGKPYIVMQYIDGVTLRSLIKPEGMALARAAQITKQMGRALAAAHDCGIFHRDLKPENIMLQSYGSDEEQVKIIDFGIAKLKGSTVGPSTSSGATAGTVSYMAPEQLTDRSISAATDNYALGAIVHELVTGRRPFNPETGFELLEMQRAGARVKPSDLRPSLSDEVDRLILRALSFEPKDRFQSARELGDALSRAINSDAETLEFPTRDRVELPPTQLSPEQAATAPKSVDASAKTLAARFEPASPPVVTPSADRSAVSLRSAPRVSFWVNMRWLKFAISFVFVAAFGVALYSVWVRSGKTPANRSNSPLTASAPAERLLTYSLTVQKMRYGKPYEQPFESSGQEIFENGWKFRMNISSPQEGYLYLLNEGPAAGGGITLNLLFPEPKTNNGEAHVTADQKLQTAWMRFEEHQGTERFWFVWSASPVKELEDVKDMVNERDQSEIKDAAKARAIRDFLNQHSSPKPEATKDSAKKQTIVKGRGAAIVSFIELEHH